MNITTMEQKIAAAQEQIEAEKDIISKASMRQKYHFMGQNGWINDPNGLIYYRGYYHYFYQYNPFDAFWGEMYWGHAISSDLLHWNYLPPALAPSESYDDNVRGGCFSGSSIEHDGKLFLFYTGATNYGKGFVQTQCVACSEDRIHFTKYSGNPVITAPAGYDEANFRDPKILAYGDDFYLIIGAKKDNLGNALLYRSKDLLHWEFVNVLAESRGEWGNMWECPDFFPIGDKFCLLFSPMGGNQRTSVYLVGDMDFLTGKFDYYISGEIDWGLDYYAPQTFADKNGRRIIVAWANGWDWMPQWKDWGPTYKQKWCGFYTIPRIVTLTKENRLRFAPAEELKQLHSEEQIRRDITVTSTRWLFPCADGISFHLKFIVDLQKTTSKEIYLYLRSNNSEETVVKFDLQKAELTVDRNNSDGWGRGISRSPLLLKNKTELPVDIFSDQSSIELFTDDYQTNHSMNVFASDDHQYNYIASKEGIVFLKEVISWKMQNAMQ